MNDNFQTFYWSKLDNVAKLYALVSSSKATNVFRISVKMTDEIQAEFLSQAVKAALVEMPTFSVRLRSGFFWYYFDMNLQKPRIRKEYTYPCSKMTKFTNNNYLFNMTYYQNMIHLEVFHALADGSGAVQFLKVILYHYLKRLHPETMIESLLEKTNDASLSAMEEDSFLKVKCELASKVIPQTTTAYKITGIKKRPQELKVIHGIMSAKSVVAIVKQYEVTVSSFLCAVLIYAIYEQNYKFNQDLHPITVTVPIDLRGRFGSHTLRNFFSNVNVTITPRVNLTFEDLLQEVSNQLAEGQQPEVIERKINDNVSAQQNMFIRFVPLAIKNKVMRHIYHEADKGVTTTLSNFGRIVLPELMSLYVKDMRVMIPVTPHQPIRCGVISCNDQFVLTFTSSLEETDIQRYFFRFLKKYGIDITISCNEEFNHEILF
ncbi:hypothetical protein [Turicibacter sp. TJ11]|uniref:hypothetical protein n=1 Tax=Turicibacter sp. TJ11 TaxID=2806443 RepID=UPI001F491DA7|nr:hypothetical protein [Turicibacter sp. TJ11]